MHVQTKYNVCDIVLSPLNGEENKIETVEVRNGDGRTCVSYQLVGDENWYSEAYLESVNNGR